MISCNDVAESLHNFVGSNADPCDTLARLAAISAPHIYALYSDQEDFTANQLHDIWYSTWKHNREICLATMNFEK